MWKLTVTVLVTLMLHGLTAEEVISVPEKEADNVYDSYRLPTAVTPENYKLEVTTHLNDTEGFLFRGVVWITVSYGLCCCNFIQYK